MDFKNGTRYWESPLQAALTSFAADLTDPTGGSGGHTGSNNVLIPSAVSGAALSRWAPSQSAGKNRLPSRPDGADAAGQSGQRQNAP